MKKMLFVFTFVGIICLVFTHIQKVEAAEPIFFADFDTAGVPNDTINDPGNWQPENPSTTWGTGVFPGNGTQALIMTASGCGSSGFTQFPTLDNWSDGIIQVDLGWNDDDSWGIMFRRNGEQSGYFAFLGYIETLDLALFDMAGGAGINGRCISDAGVEEGPEPGRTIIPDKAIAAVRHNLPEPLTQTGDTSYTARISAKGPEIKIWYGLTENFPDDPTQDPDSSKMASVIQVQDSTYTEGSVGIWHESNDSGIVDNIYVFDASALTVVASQGKLATTWGRIKR